MSFLSLKSKISIFFEQRLDSLDSTRQQLDSNCLMTNPTVSRLTEALDRLDSLDSNLEGMGGNKKPCNTCNSVQEISESELIYPQYTNIAANDQEAQEEADWHEFLYGKSTEELLYNHLLTCNQCENLSLTGSCSRLGKRVIPEALRECTFFELRQKERLSVVKPTPYSQDELHRLFNQAARPLYHHLIDCQQCSLEDARYCVEGFGLGDTFDCLLLCFDDAADKRYKLMNQVIKARVSGRRAFESLFSDNAPLPRQDAPITRKWGNTAQYEAFINHWTACEVCKPNLGRYCSEGQRLEKEANC